MNIRLININRDRGRIGDIRRLYNSAFPLAERAPFKKLLRKCKKKNVNFFSCYDGADLIGLLYVVNHLDLSYVFYLAVDEKQRGKGYGTAILKAAQKKYRGRRLFLAIEEVDKKYDNYPQRLKRLHFYENAGFVRTGRRMQEGFVIFDLMSIGGKITNKEYRRLIKSFSPTLILFFTMKILE